MNNPGSFVFFIPDLQTYAYSRPMAAFADAMLRSGRKVLMTLCTGELTRCPVMTVANTTDDNVEAVKKGLCKLCRIYANFYLKTYKIPFVSLKKCLSVREKALIAETVDKLEKDELLPFTWRGQKVGKQAFSDVSIITRNSSTIFLDDERTKLFRSYLKTVMEALVITENIVKSCNVEGFVSYQIYGIQCAVASVAASHGIGTINGTHITFLGYDMGRFELLPMPQYKYIIQWMVKHWPSLRDLPISPDSVRNSFLDVVFRNLGKNIHIFSPSKNESSDVLNLLISSLGIDPAKKILVAFTSSDDEIDSDIARLESLDAQDTFKFLFDTQIDWLSSVCEYVKNRQNLQLIIRIHPRMKSIDGDQENFPLQVYKERLTNLPDNCKVIWPDDNISSYDLMELIDLALVGWSTMGKECLRLGIPTMAYAKIFYQNDDFMVVPENREEYFQKIEVLLNQHSSMATLQRAIRCQNLLTFRGTINLDPGVPNIQTGNPFNEPKVPRVEDEKLNHLCELLTGQKNALDDYSAEIRSNIEARSLPVAIAEEIQMIKDGIAYYIESVFNRHSKIAFYNADVQALIDRFKNVDTIPKAVAKHQKKLLESYMDTAKDILPPWSPYALVYEEGYSNREDYVRQSAENDELRFLLIEENEVCYIFNGKSVTRPSRLIQRLARIVLDYDRSQIPAS